MKKYVIYTGVIFMPDGNAAAQRAKSFIKIIKGCGYTPIIVGMTNKDDYYGIIEGQTSFDDTLIFSSRYPITTIEWVKMLFDVSSLEKVIDYLGAENVQTIIAMDYFAPALYKIMRLCQKKNIRFVADAVDWFAKSYYQFPKGMIKDCDTFLRMKCLYKHVDHMITISKYLKQYYSAYVKQIVEIPGVVADNYCVQNNYQNRDELINLCFVGVPGPNCCKEKIDWVIESICELNLIEDRFRFTIAGVGRDFFEKDCPNLVKHSLFDSSVKCLGRISHLECLELVASSDFSVIVREDTLLSNAGFPTKLGESFACGTPVLVTPTSNLEDYILHGYGFVADECSKASVFKLLKEISVLRKNEIKLMRDTVKSYNPLKARAFVEVMKEVLEDANN